MHWVAHLQRVDHSAAAQHSWFFNVVIIEFVGDPESGFSVLVPAERFFAGPWAKDCEPQWPTSVSGVPMILRLSAWLRLSVASAIVLVGAWWRNTPLLVLFLCCPPGPLRR